MARVFLERGKWARLVAHPVLSAGMMYLRFRVGLSYLAQKRRGGGQAIVDPYAGRSV